MTADTIVRVDPKTLLVGPNVRTDTRLTKEFLASIKELGVRVPITAHESPDGLVVVDGQRRTLAAVDAGLTEVPVFVYEAPLEVDRIVDQVVVNEQRSDLRESEAIAAVQQLALFDMKVPAIAKKLGLDQALVADAVKVGASPVALKYFEKHAQLTEAVMLAEFDADPKQQKALVKMADEEGNWRMSERARNLIDERGKKAVTAEIEAMAGVTLIGDVRDNSSDPLPVDYLYLDETRSKPLSEVPLEQLVELAGDGLCAFPAKVYKGTERVWSATYAVKGWRERGLHADSWRLRGSSTSNAKPTTPEEIAAAKLERARARANTKEWVVATAARVEWLQQLVQRKTMPKGWEAIVAGRMLNNAGSFSTTQIRAMLAILQLEESKDSYSLRNSIEKHLAAVPTRAPQIMLAIEIGCVEGGGDFDRKGWASTWQMDQKAVGAYLTRLEGWGFTLSEIELATVAASKKGKKAA